MNSSLMSAIGSTSIIVIASYVLHNYTGPPLRGVNANFAPAIAYGFTSLCLRKTYKNTHIILLSIHAIFAFIVYRTVKHQSTVIDRALYFPLITSALARVCAPYIPFTPSSFSTACVVLLQSWSIFSAVLMLAVYPATIVSDMEPHHIRDARLEHFAHTTAERGGHVERLSVPSSRGVTLDAVVVRPAGPVPDRWIIYMGGNAEIMENSCEEMCNMPGMPCANWVFYNTRGVGRSTGYVTGVQDLIDDAAVVVHFVMRQSAIDAKRVLLWGHSIGGGIAAAVARQHSGTLAKAPLLLDRTFSCLTDAAVGFSPLPSGATRILLHAAVGELNTVADCAAVGNRKFVLFNRRDEIIPFTTASLARATACRDAGIDHKSVIELNGERGISPHNGLISDFYEFADVTRAVNLLFV